MVALMFALVVGVEAVSARIRFSLLHHGPKKEIDPLGMMAYIEEARASQWLVVLLADLE